MKKILLCFLPFIVLSGCINDYAYVNNLPTAPVFQNKKRVEAYGSLGVAHAQGSLSVRPYKNTGICLNAFSGFQGQSYLEGGLVQKFRIKNNSYFHLSAGYGQAHTNNHKSSSFSLFNSATINIAANYNQLFIQPYFSYRIEEDDDLTRAWTIGTKISWVNFSNYYMRYKYSYFSDNYTIDFSFPAMSTKSYLIFINHTVYHNSGFSLQFNLGYNILKKQKAQADLINGYANLDQWTGSNSHPFSNPLNYGFSIGFAL